MIAVYRGDEAAAAELAGEAVDQRPRDYYSHRILRDRDLDAGNLGAARDRYAAAFPELFAPDGPGVHRGNVMAAVDIAYLLQALGESDKAERLLDGAESFRAKDALLAGATRKTMMVRVHLLRGDEDNALEELQDVIDAGWREDCGGDSDGYGRAAGEPESAGVSRRLMSS